MNHTLQIDKKDNVLIALSDSETQRKGHKYAICDIRKGASIIKYGKPIGIATEDITEGAHIHTHNVKTTLGDVLDYEYKPFIESYAVTNPTRKVMVYERYNKNVGIRNELWIVPTVGCVNGIAQALINRFNQYLITHKININTLPYFDGIHTFPHPYGCSQMGEDHETTKQILQNISKHPNAGGVLILGLGCENNQIDTFLETLDDYDAARTRYLIAQESENEIDEGFKLLLELFNNMALDQRIEKPISVLNIGLECGGSDGLSGITANPLVGRFSDYLIHHGGTTVLTEVPEMFGAEQQLMNRCISQNIFVKTVTMINDFKNYYNSHSQVIYDNPSPGNKKGGITTLEDKSLGCTTKSGHCPVVDVLKSTERIRSKGLNLISAPGNDAVATTILGTCGCQMVLFTTGRGTPFGGFIPTLKISTNSELANKKEHWIDFDAGQLLNGIDMDTLLEKLIDLIVLIANGTYSCQENNNYREIAIFKSGVTL